MTGFSPSLLVKRFVRCADESLVDAERDLERAVRAGVPSFAVGAWPAGSADGCRETFGLDFDVDGYSISIAYWGLRRTGIGRYLYLSVQLASSIQQTKHSRELSFLRSILNASAGPLAIVGQTHKDMNRFGCLVGRRCDVFSYLLGAKLDRLELDRDLSGASDVYCGILDMASRMAGADRIVDVSTFASLFFMRACFRDLSSVIDRSEFDMRLRGTGVRWRPVLWMF